MRRYYYSNGITAHFVAHRKGGFCVLSEPQEGGEKRVVILHSTLADCCAKIEEIARQDAEQLRLVG